MTPTSGRRDKAPQVEERPEEARKRNPFSVITDSLNENRERCGQTRKVVWPASAFVRAKKEDTLIETLEGLLQKQTVIDLKEKNHKLKEEVKKLKEELADEKKANLVAATKLGMSLELVKKMEEVA